ncbi:hypothetical protein SPACI_054350 [Sporomusa acidovorans DSM 3132]|uniref:MurNAc-LAA domain-containing protein n=1 Tax=Sporomusa acidovorans (strain ATCC 49682 / DSM 3132 / Mol) TaxID=1123286 RepID=A0ABZ3JA68_SPOA4|nr:N-acetylmuramoyl-L-alanine amidase LytC precursor [Sporomusa acidovorans DSM 3132]SDD63080.1 N-acetylmuramoyl-L-alanine amidase [Sporomusa acidovorans]
MSNGTETLYCDGSVNGKRLAGFLQGQLIGLGGLTDRGLKTNPLYVTKHTDAPACLAELAFISNPDDAAKLGDPVWQDQFARAIARGVTRLLCSVSKPTLFNLAYGRIKRKVNIIK